MNQTEKECSESLCLGLIHAEEEEGGRKKKDSGTGEGRGMGQCIQTRARRALAGLGSWFGHLAEFMHSCKAPAEQS